MELPVNQVLHGEARDRLQSLPDDSIHAVVTDPPYNFQSDGSGGFMDKDWDDIGSSREYQQWCADWAEECYRILKPGGHLVAFSSNRQHHRLFAGVEDAGFSIRDTLVWLHSEGFPKSQDVSKDIDRKLDMEDEREVIDRDIESSGWKAQDRKNAEQGYRPNRYYDDDPDVIERTAPASEPAQHWDGWGTQLKPAAEFIVLARKPLSEDTVAENVLEHGTGAINIDGTRVPTADDDDDEGRHPANVLLDERAAAYLDAHSGESQSAQSTTEHDAYSDESMFLAGVSNPDNQYTDAGGASRFFYTSKASKAERTLDGRIENEHVAVKPLDLMKYLVRLVAAEDQIVVDPFAGTGTTLRACKHQRRNFIGVEIDKRWVNIAKARAGLEPDDPSVLTQNAQRSLGEFDQDDA